MKICDAGSKLERKTVEKNRRIHMKNLCFKLSSLIPKHQNYAKCPLFLSLFSSHSAPSSSLAPSPTLSLSPRSTPSPTRSPASSLTLAPLPHLPQRPTSPPTPASSPDTGEQMDYLNQAVAYINRLREIIEKLKQLKLRKACIETSTNDMEGFKLPIIKVRHTDSSMEVVLISGLKKRFIFHEVISILEEEGAEVINASFYVAKDKIFYTIHSQVDPRIGMKVSRILERLKELLR